MPLAPLVIGSASASEPRDLGQDQRHHGEVDAAQPQDRQADQDARRAAQNRPASGSVSQNDTP